MDSLRGTFRNWLSENASGLCVVVGSRAAADVLRDEAPDAVVLQAANLTVAECAQRLGAVLTPRAAVFRMRDLAVALDDREGGTITVLIQGLDAARDPFAVAGTVALRLAAPPIGLRVIVAVAPGAEVLAVLPTPQFTDDQGVLDEPANDALGDTETDLLSLTPLDGHRAYVQALAAVPMPGGRTLLASGCKDGVIRLWDPVSAEQFGGPIMAHLGITMLLALRLPGQVSDALSTGQTVLVSASGMVQIWDPVRAELVADLTETSGRQLAVLTRPDGSIALVVVVGDALCLVDPATGQRIGLPFGDGGKWADALLIVEHQGRVLVAVLNETAVQYEEGVRYHRKATVWDPETGQRVAHSDSVETLRADVSDTLVVGETRVHVLCRSREYGGAAIARVPLPDSRMLIATENDETLRLADPRSGATVAEVAIDGRGLTTAITALSLPDGEPLVAASTGKQIWLWKPFPATDGTVVDTPEATTVAVNPVSATFDEPSEVDLNAPPTGTAGDAVVVHEDTRHWEPVWRIEDKAFGEIQLTRIGDSPAVAVVRSGAISVWNATDGTPMLTVDAPHPGGIHGITTTTIDGRPVVVSNGLEEPEPEEPEDEEAYEAYEDACDEYEPRQLVKVWDPATGEQILEPIHLVNSPVLFGISVVDVRNAPIVIGGTNGEFAGSAEAWVLRNGNYLGMYAFSSISEDSISAVCTTTVDGRAAVVAAMTDFDADRDGDAARDLRLICVWDVLTGRQLGPGFYAEPSPTADVMDFAPMTATTVADRPVLAYWEPDGRIRLRSLPDGTPVGALRPECPDEPRTIRAARLGETPVLLVAERNGALSVWDLETTRRLSRISDLGQVYRAVLLPDGLLIAVTYEAMVGVRLVE